MTDIQSNATNNKLPRKRTSKVKKPDFELVTVFWSAPNEALFGQETIALITNRSPKTLECDRWRGQGVKYRKCSGRVLYRKADVIAWIESYELVNSTSEYEVRHA